MKRLLAFAMLVCATALIGQEAPQPADVPAPPPAESQVTTNTASAPSNSIAAASPVTITANSSVVDLRSNLVVYAGNVQVTEPRLDLTCEWLWASILPKETRLDRAIARTNVHFTLISEDGKKIHGMGEEAVYTCVVTPTETNWVVELTGNPMLRGETFTNRGEKITYDRLRGTVRTVGTILNVTPEPGSSNLLKDAISPLPSK